MSTKVLPMGYLALLSHSLRPFISLCNHLSISGRLRLLHTFMDAKYGTQGPIADVQVSCTDASHAMICKSPYSVPKAHFIIWQSQTQSHVIARSGRRQGWITSPTRQLEDRKLASFKAWHESYRASTGIYIDLRATLRAVRRVVTKRLS